MAKQPEGPPTAPAAPAGGVEEFGDIARRVKAPRPRPTTFLEWSAATWMSLLLAAIFVCVGTFLLIWWVTRPTAADVQQLLAQVPAVATTQPATPREAVELLSQLQREHSEQCRDLFQLVILTGLVPLFTLLAGYVFGKGPAAQRRADTDES